ncbi:MAG TPA: hypothetical protein PLN35_17360 [Quisquiliibacterium sp.]|nr:hypothetical protein [Quisquiliibacterium sp.]
MSGAMAHDAPGRVHLVDAQRVLGLFAQGLSGRYLHLRPIDALKGQFRPEGVTTDGASIYLPESVAEFASPRHNLGLYRIAVLHQLGYYETGTFDFSFDAACARLPSLPPERPVTREVGWAPEGARASVPAPDLDRFFAVWDAPVLMRRLFMTLEDLRIDRTMLRRYPGARADLERVMAHALDRRPEPPAGSLPAALFEGLVRYTLGADAAALCASDVSGRLRPMLDAARALDRDGADVYDSAAAAVHCYRLMAGATADEVADALAAPEAAGAERRPGGTEAGPDGQGEPRPFDGDAVATVPVDFRGEVQPGLVQRRLRAAGTVGASDGATGRTPDADAADADRDEAERRTAEVDRLALRRAFGETAAGDRSYLVDEWDFQQRVYLKGWCRVHEHRLRGDDTDFIAGVRERYALQAQQVKRQFRMIRPESLQRVRRVSDGEELELDGVIEAVIDRRAGHATDEHVYTRRDRGLRDVAAAFLVDLSASTDYPVPEPDQAPSPAAPPPAPATAPDDGDFLWGMWPAAGNPQSEAPRRRVIDVEREALALMCEALESLGDRYAVYGFSGYGRENVEIHVAKEFRDRLTSRTWAALAAMKPRRSTRMGPAIRHALARLAGQDARVKVLIVVSDGFPEDTDYGPDRNDHEYGIQDTARALQEAAAAGVSTFCVTVDRSGHDYLRRMCPDQRYMVIDEVDELPRALSKVYRALTA